MRQILRHIFTIISILFLTACSANTDNHQNTVITSFYPIYSFTAAVTDGTPITPVNLTKAVSGCLHDYQLTTGNMRLLSSSDVLIINGSGMEDGFISKAAEQNQKMHIIDSSENIEPIETEEHNHEDEDSDHNHGESNSHIWMSVENAKKQTMNIAEGLADIYPEYAEKFNQNAVDYCQKLSLLENDTKSYDINVVSFHEAFAYLCNDFGISVIETVEIDENTIPSASRLVHIADEIKENNVSAIICADDGGRVFAETMAREFDIPCLILNPVTAGSDDKNGYIAAQTENFGILKEAFANEKS